MQGHAAVVENCTLFLLATPITASTTRVAQPITNVLRLVPGRGLHKQAFLHCPAPIGGVAVLPKGVTVSYRVRFQRPEAGSV